MKTVEKKLKEYLGYEKEIKKLKNTHKMNVQGAI